jgi:hypothetical protein
MGLSGRGRGRPADLVAVAAAVVGSAAAAQVVGPSPVVLSADLARRIVKRAQHVALVAVLESLDGWIEGAKEDHEGMEHRDENRGEECWARFTSGDFRIMVNEAARVLDTDLPWVPPTVAR